MEGDFAKRQKLRQRMKTEREAVWTALCQARQEGHVYLEQPELLRRCLAQHPYLTADGVMGGVYSLQQDSLLRVRKEYCALPGTLYSENHLAEICAAYLKNNVPFDAEKHDWDTAVTEAERSLHITLSNSQRAAVTGCLDCRLSVITGGAGSGKTTLLRVLCKAFIGTGFSNCVLLMAPTGKAARRLAQQAHQPAFTIHSVLYSSIPNHMDCNFFYKAGLIVVDETSMVDIPLMCELMQHLTVTHRLVLVGDPLQLPAIGPGHVLRDLLECGLPSFRLTDNFRQADGSSELVDNIIRIRAGDSDLNFGESFHLLTEYHARAAEDAMLQQYIGMFSEGKDVQMLSPVCRMGVCSTNSLNWRAQALLNPPCQSMPEIKTEEHTFRVGDRVVQLINNEYAKNGDVGYIADIRLEKAEVLTIRFDDSGRLVSYNKAEIERRKILDHAYALSIHKAQGCEYDYVILPLVREQVRCWYNNMIYTAVTRAKKGVILIGSEQILEDAILRPMPERNTHLLQKIQVLYQRKAA